MCSWWNNHGDLACSLVHSYAVWWQHLPVMVKDNNQSWATKAVFFCYNCVNAQWYWVKTLSSFLLLSACFVCKMLLSPNNSLAGSIQSLLIAAWWWIMTHQHTSQQWPFERNVYMVSNCRWCTISQAAPMLRPGALAAVTPMRTHCRIMFSKKRAPIFQSPKQEKCGLHFLRQAVEK